MTLSISWHCHDTVSIVTPSWQRDWRRHWMRKLTYTHGHSLGHGRRQFIRNNVAMYLNETCPATLRMHSQRFVPRQWRHTAIRLYHISSCTHLRATRYVICHVKSRIVPSLHCLLQPPYLQPRLSHRGIRQNFWVGKIPPSTSSPLSSPFNFLSRPLYTSLLLPLLRSRPLRHR